MFSESVNSQFNDEEVPGYDWHTLVFCFMVGFGLIRTSHLLDVHYFFVIIFFGYVLGLYYTINRKRIGTLLILCATMFEGFIAIVFAQGFIFVRCVFVMGLAIIEFKIPENKIL